MSTTFELLMEMFQRGELQKLAAHGRKCIREGEIAGQEAATIERLLPKREYRNVAEMTQDVCRMYLNLPGASEESLRKDAGLSRMMLARAMVGNASYSYVCSRVLKAIRAKLAAMGPVKNN